MKKDLEARRRGGGGGGVERKRDGERKRENDR